MAREKRWCPLCNGQHVHGCERREVEDLVHFVVHWGSYATIRANHSTLFQLAHSHGEDDAQVPQCLFKQDNHLEFACCMREMMERRRKQLAAGRGVDTDGEVLA